MVKHGTGPRSRVSHFDVDLLKQLITKSGYGYKALALKLVINGKKPASSSIQNWVVKRGRPCRGAVEELARFFEIDPGLLSNDYKVKSRVPKKVAPPMINGKIGLVRDSIQFARETTMKTLMDNTTDIHDASALGEAMSYLNKAKDLI